MLQPEATIGIDCVVTRLIEFISYNNNNLSASMLEIYFIQINNHDSSEFTVSGLGVRN